MDTSEGTWTVYVEGIARERIVTGVMWVSEDESVNKDFQIETTVTLERPVKVGKELMKAGSLAFIVELKDPTLSPKNRKFIGVRFESKGPVAWLGLEDVEGRSEDDEFLDFVEEFEDEPPKPRYSVH